MTKRAIRSALFGATILISLSALGGCQSTGWTYKRLPLQTHPRLAANDDLRPTLKGPRLPAGESRFKTRLNAFSAALGYAHFFVPVVINGQKTKLLLDTGSPISMLHGDYALRCGIRVTDKIGTAELPLATGRLGGHVIELAWGKVDHLRLADFDLTGRAVIVSDLRAQFRLLGIPLARTDGPIGLDILRAFSLTLDFETGEAVLAHETAAPGGRTIPLMLDTPGFAARLRIAAISPDGTRILFQLDTGASGTVFLTQATRRALGIPEGAARATLCFGDVVLSDTPVRDATVDLVSADIFSRVSPRVTLDPPRGVLWLSSSPRGADDLCGTPAKP